MKRLPKSGTEKRTSPVPERVYDLKKSLGIDEALKSRIESPRGPRIRSHLVDHVVPIGRHALEVAINEAVSQKELHPRQSEWEPEWSRIADASQDAVAALDRAVQGNRSGWQRGRTFRPVHQAVARRWGWGVEGWVSCRSRKRLEGRPAIGGGQADNRQTARRYTDAQGCAFGALPQFFPRSSEAGVCQDIGRRLGFSHRGNARQAPRPVKKPVPSRS